MDDFDLNIAKMHEKQTYVSSRDVARQLGISASTVRRRMTRMFESGVIENRILVDLEVFPELYITLRKMLYKITRQLFEIEGVSGLETFVVTDNHGLRVSASTLHELFKLEKEKKSRDTVKSGKFSKTAKMMLVK